MATVVLDGPSQFPVRRLRRFVAVAIGAVIYVAGLFSVVPFFVLSLAGGGTLVDSQKQAGTDDELPPALADHLLRNWLIAAGLVVVGLPLGIRLVRGRRELVLFLRRFGYSDATRTVSAATTRIGASWRMVTLDDAQIVPMGVETLVLGVVGGVRRVTGFVKRASVVVAWIYKTAMGLAFVAAWAIVGITYLRGEDVAALVDFRGEDMSTLLDFSDQEHLTSLGAPFHALLIGLAVGAAAAVVFAVVFVVVNLIYVATIPIWAWFSSVSDAVQAAERSKTLKIYDAADVYTRATEVAKWRRKVFSPQLIVLTVDSQVWQLTVYAMAYVSAVPLIDVSEPTENLLWEIDTLRDRFGERCLFVGNIDRLGRFTGEEAPALSGSVTGRADALIANETILAYDANDPSGKRFARALRAMLQDRARRTLRTGDQPWLNRIIDWLSETTDPDEFMQDLTSVAQAAARRRA
jgi:hypothetical protein